LADDSFDLAQKPSAGFRPDNGFKPERDPVAQVKSQANWLRDTLQKSTGRPFFVQPVVLYPGWFVEQTVKNAPVWILNEIAALTFIRKSHTNKLSPEEISLVTFHLKRFVISTDANPHSK
jgi:hypothetical protein